jgi:hypothetical protein
MNSLPVRVGPLAIQPPQGEISGGIVELDGEAFYRIEGLDQMPPFFITVVSDSDHWMFLSSTGALTAGRRSPERALFPYATEDKIHDSVDLTGPKTILLVDRGEEYSLWEPFSPRYAGAYRIRRDLYKSVLGNRIVFDERNLDLGVGFRYGWSFSDRFGFVRRAQLRSLDGRDARIRILDGIQNLMPPGVDPGMQTERSNLVDAYKKSELQPDTGLGIFSLSSIPVDKPEASEALRATTVWSTLATSCSRLLSAAQLDGFRRGAGVVQETDVRATRGAYFVACEEAVSELGTVDWYLVADVHQGPAAVASLRDQLSEGSAQSEGSTLSDTVDADIEQGSRNLRRIIAAADGLQTTADPLNDARHSANVLFNVMRGGIYADGYDLDRDDLRAFVRQHNRSVADSHAAFWEGLPERLHSDTLKERVAAVGDPQLARLCRSYLPLTFSRRHGDPSRPWNRFSIETRRADGRRILNYEGNWRDIFQNWEAVSFSYPEFLEGIISLFLNASTIDGYNPYRIAREGIDWEVLDPDDPWSFIGYWGDHQIVYLLKLMELLRSHRPASLREMLAIRQFAYADVPYRIKSYAELLLDPQDTIDFDAELAREIDARVSSTGADGKLIPTADGQVRLVNLTEKLLVMVLTKLTNFIPEAGIWMNTQRPEWNDANNALVGHGVSLVTLCHMRRFLAFAHDLYAGADLTSIQVDSEVARLAGSVADTLQQHEAALDGPIDDATRRAVLDGLGQAGESYRESVYAAPGGGGDASVERADLLALFDVALCWIDHTLRANRREDGLYHSYNLITSIRDGALSTGSMHEMLEGQVAMLGSGLLSADEAADLLAELRRSALYRADQHSYLLYPDRTRPLFLDRNNIDSESAKESRLIQNLVESGDRSLVERDSAGELHFSGDFRNASDVQEALDALSRGGRAELVEAERGLILELFEDQFDHRSYTGRSSTFYGYEGLGSIYWHMVSKLLLAVADTHARAVHTGADAATLERLADRYYDIREGLGVHKNPEVHGAFPTDPYSHTPGGGGARQPGLTGQVKEDILSRWSELGVCVREGSIEFRPTLLRPEEFTGSPRTFEWVDVQGHARSLDLGEGALAFTYCQTPVVYHASDSESLRVTRVDGDEHLDGLVLPSRISREIVLRSGAVERIDVFLNHGTDQ